MLKYGSILIGKQPFANEKNGKYTVDVRVLLYILPVRRLVTKYRELIISKSPDTLFQVITLKKKTTNPQNPKNSAVVLKMETLIKKHILRSHVFIFW